MPLWIIIILMAPVYPITAYFFYRLGGRNEARRTWNEYNELLDRLKVDAMRLASVVSDVKETEEEEDDEETDDA